MHSLKNGRDSPLEIVAQSPGPLTIDMWRRFELIDMVRKKHGRQALVD